MLKKQSTGLIVVDIQGKLAHIVDDSERLLSNSKKLILGAQVLDLPIIWLEQNPAKLGATDDSLAQVMTSLTPITKFTFNACNEPQFIDAVKQTGITDWLICGIEAHICVYQTARGLLKLGHKVHLVSDCISSRSVENKKLAITKMAELGVEISGLEMCLYELVEDCRNEEFRPILHLIK